MRVYRTTGLRLLLMGAAVALARTVATGSWLPHSGKGVLLFALAELFLIPLGLLLLMWSLLLGFVERRHAARQGPARASGAVTAAFALLVFVAALVVAPRSPGGVWAVVWMWFAALSLLLAPFVLPVGMWLLSAREAIRAGRTVPSPTPAGLSLLLVVVFVIGIFPPLSRGLGWGRYGVPIKEPLCSLADVTTLSGIPVPREAKLVKGTIRWHDPNRYVYAVIEMPRGAAERYLKGQEGWKWEADPHLADASSLPRQMKQDLAGRSGVVYLNGGGPPRTPHEAPAQTVAAVSFGKDDRALICIYWMPVW
jgi:hypothetical protein